MHRTAAYAATSATAPLAPWSLERRDPRAGEVLIDIRYCGICHSDLHTVRGEWGPVDYPLVPGHEIVGHVAAVGEGVSERVAAMTAAIPTAPRPNTAIDEPDSGCRTRRTVPAPVASPHPSGPASSTGTPGGRRTTLRSVATTSDENDD